MATYQFKVEFIPKSWAEENKYSAKSLHDYNQYQGFNLYDLESAWKDYELNLDLEKLISDFLPRCKSWDNELLIWGNEEKSDVRIWLSEGKIVGFTVRLDLRDNNIKLSNDIIALAINIGCVFFFPESNQIVNPGFDELWAAINKSSASRFIDDPHLFINKINNKKED